MVPAGSWSGERPLKRDLTPESKSTNTPSRSQNILNDVSSASSSSSSALASADEKNPVSDCCFAFFLLADDLSEEPRFDMFGDNGCAEVNAAMEEQLLLDTAEEIVGQWQSGGQRAVAFSIFLSLCC